VVTAVGAWTAVRTIGLFGIGSPGGAPADAPVADPG